MLLQFIVIVKIPFLLRIEIVGTRHAVSLRDGGKNNLNRKFIWATAIN